MTIYNLGNIKGEKGDKGDSITGPTGPVGVGIKSIEQITQMKFKFCLTDGSEYIINYGDEPTFDGISVSSSKDILSYADGDSTVLSAQLTNSGSPVSVSGESVTFEVRKVSDDSLVETLTDTTDSNGEASVEYFGKGVGDLNIKCQCRSVSKTYELEDCNYYNSGTITGDNVLSIPNMPVNYYISFKTKYTASSGRVGWLNVGKDTNNLLFCGQVGSTALGVFKKVNGTQTPISTQNVLTSQNTEYLIEWTYENGQITVKCGNTTLTGSHTLTDRDLISTHIEANNSMKELKIKPL